MMPYTVSDRIRKIFSDPPGPSPDTEKIMHFRPDVDLEKLRTSDWNWIQQKKNKDPNGSGEAMLIQLNPEQQHWFHIDHDASVRAFMPTAHNSLLLMFCWLPPVRWHWKSAEVAVSQSAAIAAPPPHWENSLPNGKMQQQALKKGTETPTDLKMIISSAESEPPFFWLEPELEPESLRSRVSPLFHFEARRRKWAERNTGTGTKKKKICFKTKQKI